MTAKKLVSVNSDKDMQHIATLNMALDAKDIVAGAKETITMKAETSITLQVGGGTISMTQDGIVLDFNGTRVTLAEGVLDQVSGMIHLNKDSAG